MCVFQLVTKCVYLPHATSFYGVGMPALFCCRLSSRFPYCVCVCLLCCCATHTHTSCHCHWLSVEALLYENVDTDEDEDADKDADVPCWSCCCLSWFFFSLFFCCLFFFCLAIVAVAYIDIVVKSFKVFIFFSLSPFSQHFAVLSLFCRFHFLFL